MKLHKSQSGFAPLAALLVLALIGTVSFAGWKVYETSKAVEPEASSTIPNPDLKPETTPDIPEGFVEYKNEELGFRFAYPREWGEVKIRNNIESQKANAEKGDLYYIEFSDSKLFRMALASRDFEVLVGKDSSSCDPVFSLHDKPTNVEPSEKRADGTTIFQELLIDNENLYALESFQYVAEESYAIGWCPGVLVSGFSYFMPTHKFPGVGFTWYQQYGCCDYGATTEADANMYKENKKSALSEDVRKQVLLTAKSIQEL